MNQLRPRASTGIRGLDSILEGGFPTQEVYLVQGRPGTGKTILGLQFLRAGVEAGETCLFFSFSQRAEGIRTIAASHGWTTDDIHIHELSASSVIERREADQVIFETSLVELARMVDEIEDVLARVGADRVVFDAVSQFRFLVNDPARARRQFLVLLDLFQKQGATVLLIDTSDETEEGLDLQSLVDGVLRLEQRSTKYGNVRRSLEVLKVRAMDFDAGVHDFRIRTGGLAVFPRLRDEHPASDGWQLIPSGVEALDDLLGGGLAEGTSALLLGPSGVGKSSIATLYAVSAAKRGEASSFFLFDERRETFVRRSEGLGLDVEDALDKGLISLYAIRTGALIPGEFAELVREEVRTRDVKLVVIDSLTGYRSAMPDDQFLITQMHDLLHYLSDHGVLTFLISTEHGLVGTSLRTFADISYLADTVLLLRHFEAEGSLRKAISVFKKRYGAHENRIRELRLAANDSVQIGAPLKDFTGVLSGEPRYHGTGEELFDARGSR